MRFKSMQHLAAAGGLFILMVGPNVGCGSSSGDGIFVNNSMFSNVKLSSTRGEFFAPTSAVPDAADQFIYFTASGEHGRGIFKTPSTRLSHNEIKAGPPFVEPIDLVLSTDGQTIYVADRLAGETGRIFAMPVGGGEPVVVPGTEGTAPTSIDVMNFGGLDELVYTGRVPSNSNPAVFSIPGGGAASATIIGEGAPLIEPSGVTIGKDGAVYVADRGSLEFNLGQSIIIRYPSNLAAKGGRATPTTIATGFRGGLPPGIVLSPDGKSVLVSSLSPSGHSQVMAVELATGKKSVFNNVIGVNYSAGGLHGAKDATGQLTGTYAWADLTADGGGGGVYRLR